MTGVGDRRNLKETGRIRKESCGLSLSDLTLRAVIELSDLNNYNNCINTNGVLVRKAADQWG